MRSWLSLLVFVDARGRAPRAARSFVGRRAGTCTERRGSSRAARRARQSRDRDDSRRPRSVGCAQARSACAALSRRARRATARARTMSGRERVGGEDLLVGHHAQELRLDRSGSERPSCTIGLLLAMHRPSPRGPPRQPAARRRKWSRGRGKASSDGRSESSGSSPGVRRRRRGERRRHLLEPVAGHGLSDQRCRLDSGTR